MVLVADGGSTKCDWVVLDQKGMVILETKTKGLNPSVFQEETLSSRLHANLELQQIKGKISQVEFYGAGCGTKIPTQRLKRILESYFSKATVLVEEDTMAAVKALKQHPSIVCILGTGSNVCFYDGEKINNPVASLGYIIMDEASGNFFGKKLLQDYFYRKMPKETAEAFEQKFDLNPDEIKEHLYQRENPNAYLANFASFIFTQKEINPYFYHILKEGIVEFIENRILLFEESNKYPIHFVGSIAHFSKAIIKESLRERGLELGEIIKRPITHLITHHQNKISNGVKEN
ncbi:N-acetylglucosamine kinase [Mesonia sp. MT50]|uniref:N-acetylglucosamine kinase n=1 Tax=Mesonia profundi TaxID=3070998 RepID=A0ABU1A4L1_9FLAO|nr:N-acetylglucosamine kinase [Mesonia profundi]MDQ7917814.1 N-acetylglucosamine kinase [Mesonia profundi]